MGQEVLCNCCILAIYVHVLVLCISALKPPSSITLQIAMYENDLVEHQKMKPTPGKSSRSAVSAIIVLR